MPAGVAGITPWLVTIAVVAALGGVRGALDDALGPAGIGFAIAMGTVIAAGLATTIVLSLRGARGPQAWLDLDARGILVSNRAGRVLLEATAHTLVARPLSCTYRGRMSITTPVLALSAPGFAEVTIGVNEFGAGWPGPVPSCRSPRFVIGGADWNALLERLRTDPKTARSLSCSVK